MKVKIIRQKYGHEKRFSYTKKSPPTSKIEMFWKVNRLTLVAVENFDLPVGHPSRVTVWFHDLLVKEGAFLYSVTASGKQRKWTLCDLAKQLSNKELVVFPHKRKRKEITTGSLYP